MLQYISANTTQLDVQNLDSAVSRVFDSLMPNPLLNSPTLQTGIVFSGYTGIEVSHMLGRVPKGYIIVSLTSAAIIFTSNTVNPNPAAYIILQSNAATIASILFF